MDNPAMIFQELKRMLKIGVQEGIFVVVNKLEVTACPEREEGWVFMKSLSFFGRNEYFFRLVFPVRQSPSLQFKLIIFYASMLLYE